MKIEKPDFMKEKGYKRCPKCKKIVYFDKTHKKCPYCGKEL